MHTASQRTLRPSSVGYAPALVLLLGYWSYAAAYDPVLDPLRDFLVRHVTRFVTKSLQGSVEVGALRGSLLGSPVLQNITLRDKQGTVVAQIAELRLVYDLKALLKKRLDVQLAEIVRPQVTLIQEPDGSFNITNLLSPAQPSTAEGGLALALAIDNLQIRDGQVVL